MHSTKLLFTALVLLSTPVWAHHNWSVQYDRDEMVEIQGVISEVKWVNPHVHFKVTVAAGTEQQVTWTIASTSVSSLARMGVSGEALTLGDDVRMAGYASKKITNDMYMINLLLPDGREAVFSVSAKQRWSVDRLGDSDRVRQDSVKDDTAASPSSIFGVWVTKFGDAESRGLLPRNTKDFPLSERGLQAIDDYNPETDNPYGSCAPKGGVAVMDAPYPVELVDKQETILFKLEEYDTVRTINLTDMHDDRNVEPSLLGYSSGRWIDDTLIINTSKINYSFLHLGALPDYVPQGEDMQMLETLKLDKQNNRLLYTLTVIDTEILTRPAVFNKFFVWRPNEKLQPYKCDEQV